MEQELISVIVPVYNVERYLKKCIDSLRNQTYTNIEIILIDDGSSDQSGDICDYYAKSDSRIRVIHQENQGVSLSRNVGLRVASGTYIAFVDPDDWIERNMYQYLYQQLQDSGADICVCACFWEHIHQNQTDILAMSCDQTYSAQEAIKLIFSRNGLKGVVWNKLFRSSVLYDLDRNVKFLFDSDISIWEDILWLSHVVPSVKSIHYVSLPLYHYIERIDSACTRVFQPSKLCTLLAQEKIQSALHQQDQIMQGILDNFFYTRFWELIFEIYITAPEYDKYIDKFKQKLKYFQERGNLSKKNKKTSYLLGCPIVEKTLVFLLKKKRVFKYKYFIREKEK